MLNLRNLRNKKVGVLGLGKTGLSVVNALEQAGALLTCWDDDKEKRDNLKGNEIAVRDLNDKNLIGELDLLIVSPGVPHLYPKAHPIVTLAYELNIRVDNDIGLFFSNHIQEEYETFSDPPKIIAITGSNGKSTATALARHVFSQVFRDVEFDMGHCGGLALCASCHCYIESTHSLKNKDLEEESMLEQLQNINSEKSRLICQIPMDKSLDGIVIRIVRD